MFVHSKWLARLTLQVDKKERGAMLPIGDYPIAPKGGGPQTRLKSMGSALACSEAGFGRFAVINCFAFASSRRRSFIRSVASERASEMCGGDVRVRGEDEG